MFGRIPCPGMYLEHKKSNPKLFVGYCKGFIKHNYPTEKAIGIKTFPDGSCYILTMPDYTARKPIVKGRGKDKKVTYEPAWKVPVERFLNEDDFKYLAERGMDKHGNKINRK